MFSDLLHLIFKRDTEEVAPWTLKNSPGLNTGWGHQGVKETKFSKLAVSKQKSSIGKKMATSTSAHSS